MHTPTRFSLGAPGDPDLLVPFARRAEELGFGGLWTQDTLNGANFSLDGLHVLSHLAAVTERVRLGIGVLYSGRRNPAVLARELATVDQLCRGRLTVGLGVGNAYHRGTLAALGIDTTRPVRRLVEGIEVLRALWSREDYHGELYSFAGVRSQPEPVQRPGPPIWIGARAEPALRRAVRIADGWTGAAPVSTADFLRQLDVVRRELAATGRDPTGFAVSKSVYLAVEDTVQRARERLAPVFDRSFGANPVYDATDMADRVAVFGPPDHCAEQLRELVDAGVDELILYPMYDRLDQLDGFAEVVASLVGAPRP
ncbi:alkanesulfonate monooxygenase SsuD/methylene tetrahydromethanopterin reductase-like flavin-dependent oxidoreductase (luciferase family) [Saccharothrix tamanrassetensis]|uniref:Alkanesulfonate monooxygenase SsuD/methylene tetrahydromethanopterin reductase-like flavin-dependent oxidoreductase (Luciferase family) n=1 Tax=Saccharothrix tamanrassetensis TaxID=1051531 RepID=A0A841CJ17_9PSEU|nr:LLM class flavin-dependent oxidoreductase [Saccharothrix tamanrassetensis]MBB5956973.1 alkanesulfonate monooxygenase SsuD/methylene tetrahydromethanopterin reductase-like flavin-dependent oxidoreductase (luciferase family) [Saccharothrix tamanrassetensis]